MSEEALFHLPTPDDESQSTDRRARTDDDPPQAPQAQPTDRAEPGPPRSPQALQAPQAPPRPAAPQAAASREQHGTAGRVTAERVLRPAARPRRHGWRDAITRLTGGRISPRPAPDHERRRRLEQAVRTPLAGPRCVAVVSPKGGVGKTTTAVNLGHMLASRRGDRVVALDGNPDVGSLAYRVRRETAATAADLLADLDDLTHYAQVRAYTNQATSRLEVVAAPDDPRIVTALEGEDYLRLLELLRRFHQLILVDCGPGILDPATRAIVGTADQLVVVTRPSLDEARTTSFLLDWLERHGHGPLVRHAVAVMNAVPDDDGQVDLDELVSHFSERCWHTVTIPWDRSLAAGGIAELERLVPAVREAYLEVAAAVVMTLREPAPESAESAGGGPRSPGARPQ